MAMLQVLSISIDGVPDNEKTCRDEIEKDRGRSSSAGEPLCPGSITLPQSREIVERLTP